MAQYHEFTLDQGTDTTIELHLVDANGAAKNLLGYTVSGRVKKNYNSDSSDTTVFTTQITSNTEGTATLSLTNTQTNAMKAGRHVYDVEIAHNDSSGNTLVERVLEGRIQITPSVTK